MGDYIKIKKKGMMWRLSRLFVGLCEMLEPFVPFLKLSLIQADSDLDVKDYLAYTMMKSVFLGLFMSLITFFFMDAFHMDEFKRFLLPIFIFLFLVFFLRGLAFPKYIGDIRSRDIEKNLLPVLRTIMIQINSGVPFFQVLNSISKEHYGEISVMFGKAVREINAGTPEVEAFELMLTSTSSLLFRRAIWQIINGMKSGADISSILGEIAHTLSQEQLNQIQRYGTQLNPLAIFYMMVAIIIPALAITFIIVISSFLSLPSTIITVLFWSLFGLVAFFQVMCLGVIKSKRPNLMRD